MSNHEVVVKIVEYAVDHPNADRLDIVKLEGLRHTIISAKGNYKKGDYVLFIPDSCILTDEMVKYFDLSFLHNNMVKVVKIRGVHSQALILPLEKVIEFNNKVNYEEGIDFSNVLGIVRNIENNAGDAKGDLPYGVERYDLENAERYPELFEMCYDKPVYISEKLEGTNCTVHLTKNNELQYCSRSLIRGDGIYQLVPESLSIDKKIFEIKKEYECETVTIRGEIVGDGVQGNIYQLPNKMFYAFDIMIDGIYVDGHSFLSIVDEFKIDTAPEIYSGLLKDYAKDIDELKEKSNGKSEILNPVLSSVVLREGIVITTLNNPRVIFKQRSPEYLSK